MSMEYEATAKTYKQIPIGTHTAICYLIADIGTQKTKFPGEEEEKDVHQIILGWETPDEKTDDGKPLSIIKTYTLPSDWTNDKAALPKDYRAWTKEVAPKTYNLAKLLGTGCNINVGLTSGGKAKVTGISALKASEQVPNLVAEPVCFDMRNPNDNALGRLPQFIKEKILNSPEYKAYILRSNTPIEETLNDAIGF